MFRAFFVALGATLGICTGLIAGFVLLCYAIGLLDRLGLLAPLSAF